MPQVSSCFSWASSNLHRDNPLYYVFAMALSIRSLLPPTIHALQLQSAQLEHAARDAQSPDAVALVNSHNMNAVR
jgi:hypothetical protein